MRFVHATVLEIDKKVMRFVHATVLEIEYNDKKWCVMYTLLCWKLNETTKSDA